MALLQITLIVASAACAMADCPTFAILYFLMFLFTTS